MVYNPPRFIKQHTSDNPLEVNLVYQVRSCGSCHYFWPKNPNQQPYGPYPAYDFNSNTPKINTSSDNPVFHDWTQGKTKLACFPNPAIMDGCRKAPIMTIGINPNLTAFASNPIGASWCYPNFTSDDNTNEWAKYAYYYRHRSVYQERFQLNFVKKNLLKEDRIIAEKAGKVISALQTSDLPKIELIVQYDDEPNPTILTLRWEHGKPRYIVLANSNESNHFEKGDILAARLNVKANKDVELYQEQVGYYEQFVPTLKRFETFLHKKGHKTAILSIGEDVCQLDMVACASPHWGPQFLGGITSEHSIIENCVRMNAWSMKQIVQTRPVVLFLVGEASYNMFRNTFNAHIKREPELSKHPSDGAFTLLSETADPNSPCYFEFDTTIDGHRYQLSTRLVITPHFSYKVNFLSQFRMSQRNWYGFEKNFASCAEFLKTDPRLEFVHPEHTGQYVAILIKENEEDVYHTLKTDYSNAMKNLYRHYYNPHKQMTTILEELYNTGKLSFDSSKNSLQQHLHRTAGPCHFCVNHNWHFPEGCSYGKTNDKPLPHGYLEKVTEKIIATGRG